MKINLQFIILKKIDISRNTVDMVKKRIVYLLIKVQNTKNLSYQTIKILV